MKYLDLTLPTPAENLACDEALLDACHHEPAAEVLRFHEWRRAAVVVGYSNRRAVEVDLSACEALGVPVLRRISGGGAVVLGPGCLAYSLALRIPGDGALANVPGTNQFVMERNRAAIERALSQPVSVQGHTDLVVDGRKFSGNSQRRRSDALLFHGTFLLGFDLTLLSGLLRPPSRQPEYRANRPHADFVTNIGLHAAAVKVALREAWGAVEPWKGLLDEPVRRLVAQRYDRAEWHARY